MSTKCTVGQFTFEVGALVNKKTCAKGEGIGRRSGRVNERYNRHTA